jgi:large subunit ribosomal protein L9
MKIILLTDVPKVGNRYDVKELKDGFAQNVLIARNLAILATPKALADLENRKSKISQKKNEEIKTFDDLIENLKDKKISIKAKANEKGHLFKAINSKDVANAIKEENGAQINEDYLVMDHIKELGVHQINLKKGKLEGKFEVEIIAQ